MCNVRVAGHWYQGINTQDNTNLIHTKLKLIRWNWNWELYTTAPRSKTGWTLMDRSDGTLTKRAGNSSLDLIIILYIICWSLIKKRHFSHQNPEQPERPVSPVLVLDHSQGHTTTVAPRNKHMPERKFLLYNGLYSHHFTPTESCVNCITILFHKIIA